MKLKGRNKVSHEFSMSSMTDIVFLLLVFFMLTANTPKHWIFYCLRRKVSQPIRKMISVSINKDLAYFLDNKPIQPEDLEQELQQALQGKETPTIILRVEESVAIEKAVTVMDIANQNNFKVILAVRPN